MLRRALVSLTIVLALVLAAVGAQAGLFVGAEDALLTPEARFQEEQDLAGSCPGGLLAGFAAVDVTPGEKQPDGTYALWQEPYEDENGNGFYDGPDPVNGIVTSEPFTDENFNGKWDGPYMAGYGHEKEPGGYYTAYAVHDPVWARAVALTCGDLTVGLVSVDTVGLFRDFVQAVRAGSPADYDHVTIASTHTHDSIDTMGLWGPSQVIDGKDPRTMEHYHHSIVRALEEALAARAAVASVRVAAGTTGYLIPVVGTVQTDLRDPFVVDDTIVAIQIVGEHGDTIGTIVNWSPHPETLAGTVGEISSDYPHWLRRAIETDGATVGGDTESALGGTAVFFSGAVGGMMTTLGARPLDEQGNPLPDHSYAKAARIGEVAAYVALHALKTAPAMTPDSLRVQSRLANVPADNAFLFALNTLGVLDHSVAVGPAEVPGIGPLGNVPPIPMLRAETNVITLGAGDENALQMLTIPGELLPEVALGNPLAHDAEATLDACFAFDAAKLLFNGQREGKVNPATGAREGGFARVLAANPSYPKEPAFLHMADARAVMMLGLANDELGYIVSADDYVSATAFPSVYSDGRDRCGDSDHYEETNSASSLMAPAIANVLAQTLDPTFVPAPMPPATSAGGVDTSTWTVWLDTSRSGGYESQEDTRVQGGDFSALGAGCWGFLNGHGQDMGQEPSEDSHGLWLDLDGDCAVGAKDVVVFEDFWAQSEGQPRWRP